MLDINFFDYLEENKYVVVILGSLFIWFSTALGAGFVFFFKKTNEKVMNGFLGAAAGIMIAASFWSLLAPAEEMALKITDKPYIPMTVGFLLGAFFIFLVDRLTPHEHLLDSVPEGPKSDMRRTSLLLIAITIHNIPEGLAVGIAFGAALDGSISILEASTLAFGIAIQDIPEGASISIPLRQYGFSRFKSFMYGQLSGFIETISAVVGLIITAFIGEIIPYALAFAAGAMIYVVLEELIPSAKNGTHSDYATVGGILGFALMMFLDVSLG